MQRLLFYGTRRFAVAVMVALLTLAIGCEQPATDESSAAFKIPEAASIPADAEQFTLGATSDMWFLSAGDSANVLATSGSPSGVLALTSATAVDAVLQFEFSPQAIDKNGDTDFLATNQYPTVKFYSTQVKAVADAFEVEGVLELRGVKQPVVFPAQIVIGELQVTAQAELTLDPGSFGISENIGGNLLLRMHIEASRN